MDIVLSLTNNKSTFIIGLFIFLSTDSLIAFKAQILYSFGLFFILVLKLVYRSPRPFWSDKNISVLGGDCNFSFSSPSSHLFNIAFYFSYQAYMNLV